MKLTFKLKKNPQPISTKKIRKNVFSYQYIYIVVYLAAAGALAYVGYFIYHNYYQTVTQAQQIVDLRKEVAPDSIDINKVNKVLAAIDEKSTSTEAIIPADTKNPFDLSSTSKPPEVAPLATSTENVANSTQQ